jgi:hypothetical protein
MLRRWQAGARLVVALASAVTIGIGVAEAGAQKKGRYKVDGESCVWDVNDTGPNQCTPRNRGRFKEVGRSCRWVRNDDGPDQCQPPRGKWHLVRNRCVWDPNGTGGSTCNPRQPR